MTARDDGPMTTRLVLATHNAGKVTELRTILDGLAVTLLSADDVQLPDVDETGNSFAANAMLKARAAVQATQLPCVADDSGLAVDALDGAPGIYSARWAARHGHTDAEGNVDAANLAVLLTQLEGLDPAHRTARFVCAAVLALPDGTQHTVEATLEGSVVDQPRGQGGFGYDPVFVPLGESRTTAEMRADEKHAISHRGRAFRALRPVIAELV